MADDPYGGGLLGSFGTALGGLLGGENPLANLAIGYLSQVGPTTTPQSPFQRLGGAAMYASQAQQNAMQNQLYRAKLAESVRESKAQADLQELIRTHPEMLPAGVAPEFAASVLGADPSAASKFIPQALTPEATAMLSAGYPAIAKAQLDLTKEQQLGKIEESTSNTTIDNAIEANAIIDRMSKGPIPPGSGAANIVKSLSDPETGFLNAPPSQIAEVIARATGRPFTSEQAHAFQTDWNRLNKLSAKFVTDQRNLQTQQVATGGQGRQTDMGLSLIEKQNISPYVTGDANKLILRDLVKKQFDIGDIRGWSLKNADRGREALAQWDKELVPMDYSAPTIEAPAPGGASVPGVPGVSTEPSLTDTVLGGIQSGANAVRGLFKPPSATATPTPEVPGPAPRGVKTQSLVPVPGYGNVPKYPRKADGERGVGKGEYFIAPDPKTGELSLWQK